MARLSYCISSKGISAFSGIYMSNIKLGIYAKHKIKNIYILFYHKKINSYEKTKITSQLENTRRQMMT